MKESFMSAVITWIISAVCMVFAIVHLTYGEEVIFWVLFVISMVTCYVAYTDYVDWTNHR